MKISLSNNEFCNNFAKNKTGQSTMKEQRLSSGKFISMSDIASPWGRIKYNHPRVDCPVFINLLGAGNLPIIIKG